MPQVDLCRRWICAASGSVPQVDLRRKWIWGSVPASVGIWTKLEPDPEFAGTGLDRNWAGPGLGLDRGWAWIGAGPGSDPGLG